MERFAPGHHMYGVEPDEEEEEEEVTVTVNMTRTMTYSYQMYQSDAASFFGVEDTPRAVREAAEAARYLTWDQGNEVADNGDRNDTEDTLDEIEVE